jgi:bifunctional ADP-heptose synthase (sugar kinase/adenylyltransferase)
VRATFLARNDAPTIVKRRYRESYFGTPLFEINYLNDQALSQADDEQLCRVLESHVPAYDAVIVADYGHSMLSEQARQIVCDAAAFVAVNPQVNSANVGYQTISKYPRADFVVLAQQELELECRNRNRSLREMVLQLLDLVDVSTIVVTLGKRGCLCYNRETGFHEAPALAAKVVDREGAADAFFAVAALCAVAGVPLDLLAFLGNVAGAEAVGVVGNSRFLEPLPFTRHIQSLLK